MTSLSTDSSYNDCREHRLARPVVMEISLPPLFISARTHTHRFKQFWEASTKQHAFSSAKFGNIPPLLQPLPRVSPGSWDLGRNWLWKLEILPSKKEKTTAKLVLFFPEGKKRYVYWAKLWTKSKSITFRPAGYFSLPDYLWIWYVKALKLCWNTIMQITRNSAGMAWLLTLLFSQYQASDLISTGIHKVMQDFLYSFMFL